MDLIGWRLHAGALAHLRGPLPRPALDRMDNRRKPVLTLLALVVSAAGTVAVLALGLLLLAR
jgi:hypothetical protein